jgi:ubiquitin-conjugating enzyme E2 S
MSTSSSSSAAARAVYRQYSSNSNSASENLPPRTLARVAREVRDLHKNPPEGVRLVVDSDTGVPSNLSELMAEVKGPTGTPYENKFFLLKLVFSSDFPAVPPRGFFLTKIYHPNVDNATGAICVNTLKKDWNATTALSHVLAVIRCLLIVPFPESSLNDEAGKLFMESYEEYSKRARLMADVHGRTTSACAAPDEDDPDQDDPDSPVDEHSVRVLQSSSDNQNALPNGSSKANAAAANKKKTASKLIKKKSLKRL